MKYLAILIAMALLFAGCCTVDESFVRAVDDNWKIMGPNYRKYVEADTKLPETSKKQRLSAIDEFSDLVKEAKAAIDKEN